MSWSLWNSILNTSHHHQSPLNFFRFNFLSSFDLHQLFSSNSFNNVQLCIENPSKTFHDFANFVIHSEKFSRTKMMNFMLIDFWVIFLEIVWKSLIVQCVEQTDDLKSVSPSIYSMETWFDRSYSVEESSIESLCLASSDRPYSMLESTADPFASWTHKNRLFFFLSAARAKVYAICLSFQ